MRKLILILVLLLTLLGCVTTSTNKEKSNVSDYTMTDLEELYIPTGKVYPALAVDSAVAYHSNMLIPPSFKYNQIGMITINTTNKLSGFNMNYKQPDASEYYKLLKDYAKTKGANAIIMLDQAMDSEMKGFSAKYTSKATFAFGRTNEL